MAWQSLDRARRENLVQSKHEVLTATDGKSREQKNEDPRMGKKGEPMGGGGCLWHRPIRGQWTALIVRDCQRRETAGGSTNLCSHECQPSVSITSRANRGQGPYRRYEYYNASVSARACILRSSNALMRNSAGGSCDFRFYRLALPFTGCRTTEGQGACSR